MDHIEQHLDQPLDLETLAAVAHFSAFHFHRLFRAWTGETLGDHLRRLDGHLPRREVDVSDAESQDSADDQDSNPAMRVLAEAIEQAGHTFEYFVFRIIANPFTSSRIPSSSEKRGRYPVRSIFSFEMM